MIGPHAAAGLRLALFTGARSGEITAIQWEHIDWQRKQVRLPDSKTNTPRTIHLTDAAIEVLKTLPRVGPFVIAGAKPGEAYKNLSRAWIIAREYAGLQDVRLHDLRHSYAVPRRRSRCLAANDRQAAGPPGGGDDAAIRASRPRPSRIGQRRTRCGDDCRHREAPCPRVANVVRLKQPRKPRPRP